MKVIIKMESQHRGCWYRQNDQSQTQRKCSSDTKQKQKKTQFQNFNPYQRTIFVEPDQYDVFLIVDWCCNVLQTLLHFFGCTN